MESLGDITGGSRAVIVAGMHRSGTSALTRVLNLRGVYLGDDLMPPAAENNETGFWEHRQIQILHERILVQLYRDWNSCWPLPRGWASDPAIAPLRAELAEIVRRDFGSRPLWGLKDPRTCFLIEMWRSLLAELEVRPAMVMIFRNPAEIARSLERRDGMPASQAYLIWLWSLLLSERETRGMTRTLTSYERLLANWEGEISRMGQELQLVWPVSATEARAEIETFLSPSLRHNIVDDQAFLGDDSIPGIVKRAYTAALAGLNGDGQRLSATVDELLEEMGKTEPLLSQYVLDLEFRHRAMVMHRNVLLQQVQSPQEAAATVAQIPESPVGEAPVGEAPVAEAPVAEAPVAEATVEEAPLAEAPLAVAEAVESAGTPRIFEVSVEGNEADAEAEPAPVSTAVAETEALPADATPEANRTRSVFETAVAEPGENGDGRAADETREESNGLELIGEETETGEHANGELQPGFTEIDSGLKSPVAGRFQPGIDSTARSMQWWRSRSARNLRKARAGSNDLAKQLDRSRQIEAESQRRALTLEWRLAVQAAKPDYEGALGWAGFVSDRIGEVFAGLARSIRIAGKSIYLRDRKAALLAENLRLLTDSGLYDETFYRNHNGDVEAAGLKMLEHYFKWGGIEGRNPSAHFDSQWYLSRNADVAANGINPLWHYLSRGAAEGRSPLRQFDPAHYLSRSATLPGGTPTPLDVYLWRLLRRLDLLAVAAPDRLTFAERTAFRFRRVRRFAVAAVGAAVHRIRVLGPAAFVRDLPMLARQSVDYYRALTAPAASAEPHIPPQMPRYEAWLSVNTWTIGAKNELKDRLREAAGLPRISVLMPVYNTPIRYLEMAIQSVRNQVYEDWELCIADDFSTDPAVRTVLQKWEAVDSRIKVVYREENGHISRATNSAAELATGEFLIFLDHDDELTPDALAEVGIYLVEHAECDFVYSDSDKVDESGRRYDAEFKPGWSPELLLSYMYFTHLCAVRRTLFEEIGGVRPGFEGSQDYDFALRATEKARKVGHIPQIFYHWRAITGSTALSGAAKPSSFAAGQRAVQEAMERRGLRGIVGRPEWAEAGRLGIFAAEFPDDGPSVEILIPTKNGLTTFRRCIESLKQTSYRNFAVTILDNESDDAAVLEYLSRSGHRVLKVNTGGKFNFAAINNRGVEAAEGEFVLLLNNDTEVIDESWLSRMVGYALQTGVGAVGARLLYPDGRIQHAGVVHGLHGGLAGHAFKLLSRWDGGYLGHAKLTRNYSAVTAACMLTPRKLYLEMGGLDEEDFGVAYNDCDYCYRLVDAGYRCVYVAGAELIHHEGASRGFKDNPAELTHYRRKYGRRVDSNYSPHLSVDDEKFHIKPTRVPRGKIRKFRACIVSHSLGYTGAPHTQYEVVMAMVQRGVLEPVVVCPQDGPLRALYESHGVEVHILPEHPFALVCGRPELFDDAMKELGRRMKEEWKAKIVYANTLETVWGIDAASRVGIPSVWNVHESDGWKEHFPWPAIADRCLACIAKPYRIIFGSDATRAVYAPLDTAHNFATVPSSLDLCRLQSLVADWTRESARRSFEIENHELVFLIVGTVCARKGQIDLIQALHRLPQAVWQRMRVVIVGDRPGPYSTELARLVKELEPGLQERVNVIAETAEMGRYYRSADVFVCCSRVECYPRVTLEAMAFGLPLITTPVFGIREQVQAGVNGVFYDPGNIEQLSQAIMTLATDDLMRHQMGEQSPAVLSSLMGFEEAVDRYQQAFQGAYLAGL